ncbi:hypothetical protein OpiT1DRAFT_03999 [Opitutaceae bacterium TAV1]|nr:hypothetical protein OpiT1DRAFT_03999 [Opitutaceae bacterium TAV1]
MVRKLESQDARLFLSERLPGFSGLDAGEAAKVVAECVEAANLFGFYDTLNRICRRAQREATDTTLTLGHITSAVTHVRRIYS